MQNVDDSMFILVSSRAYATGVRVCLPSDPDVCRLSPGYRRLSRCEEIPTGVHPEWNGDVRVKRQTRPRCMVGNTDILAKYPVVISDAEKTFSAAGVLRTKVGSCNKSGNPV